VHIVYLTGFKNRTSALMHWTISFLGSGRSERVATEQQVFGRLALERLDHGAADLVPNGSEYVASRVALEERRRAELEAKAREEARLTDSGERGHHRERVKSGVGGSSSDLDGSISGV
jgi:NADH dehydrogenase